MNQGDQESAIRLAIEVAVYLALIFGLLAWCLEIFYPFLSLVMWGTIIAISVYTPFIKLRGMLGGSSKLAVTVFTLLGLGIIIVPVGLFAESTVSSVTDFSASAAAGEFKVPPPAENVKGWPLIGERVYDSWQLASTNLEGWMERNSDQLNTLARRAVAGVAGLGISVLQFIAATLLAAFFLSNAEKLRAGALLFCRRLARDRGDEMLNTSVATIRSVTVGVLGIAFLQALLSGAGMVVVGVPGAGVWALVVMILTIAQLPALIVLLPVIVYVFSIETTTVASIFAIWSIVVGSSDAVLKPLLLGRGVDTPMVVVLIGAIGGMLMSGIIGLFVGAVVFTLGYTLVKAWLEMVDDPAESVEPAGATD